MTLILKAVAFVAVVAVVLTVRWAWRRACAVSARTADHMGGDHFILDR